MKLPSYRKHGSADRALVEYKGKRTLLPGPYNSLESRQAYKAFIARYVAAPDPERPLGPGVLVAELVRAYLRFARAHYGDGYRGEFANIRHAMRHLLALCAADRADTFGPLRLKEFQKYLADKKLSRRYVNQVVGKVKRMFKWAVSEEIVPASVHHGLESVPGLRPGKTSARETDPKRPVSWEHVFLTLTELSPTITAMVLLQWHTGARSDSICNAAGSQFNRSVDPWEWRPKHKTEHLGKEVVLYCGPKCQELLAPIIRRKGDGLLFSPRSQRANRRYNRVYRSSAYYRAIYRAIDRVNAHRAKTGEPPIPHWTPHQIRHAKGTFVRHTYGIETAQAVLGHASLDATEIYSERRRELARKVAREIG
jgi:integrase